MGSNRELGTVILKDATKLFCLLILEHLILDESFIIFEAIKCSITSFVSVSGERREIKIDLGLGTEVRIFGGELLAVGSLSVEVPALSMLFEEEICLEPDLHWLRKSCFPFLFFYYLGW